MMKRFAAEVPAGTGKDLYGLAEELYPICRSITGQGVRDTLQHLRQHIDLEIHEVPTGTPVYDWVIPKEWNIRDAYIKDANGNRIVDFRASNLHVVNYSSPIHARMSLSELRPHLITLPTHPDWIPYRTSYYKETWGFCLAHSQLESMDEGPYEVCIDTSLENGHLTYGELFLKGQKENEVLLSCHVCHPSLCNDNLSGLAVATLLARYLKSQPREYSYRFLFIPSTIGAIAWLCRNEQSVDRIKHGLVLACVGDPGPFTYKKSRRSDAEIDQAASHILRHQGRRYELRDFSPYGYDERQFCSPGFNLPVGCFMRTPHGEFPEYHSSADNLSLITPDALQDSFAAILGIIEVLERNAYYRNVSPKGEPRLGKRGLYRSTGGGESVQRELALLWVLNLSDGNYSLLDIAERSGLAFAVIADAAEALVECKLLVRLQEKAHA